MVIIAHLINSRIQAYSLAPSPSYRIKRLPVVCLYDYFSHWWICLLFVFTIAGIIYEFVPKEAITKYIRSSKALRYGLAIGMVLFLTVCLYTIVPLFGGVLYAGTGIGSEVFLPEEMIDEYLTGINGVLLASVLGGPLYTPTLAEIVLGRGILLRRE